MSLRGCRGREAKLKPERTIILSIYLSSSAFKRRGNNDAARETFGNLLRRERKRGGEGGRGRGVDRERHGLNDKRDEEGEEERERECVCERIESR